MTVFGRKVQQSLDDKQMSQKDLAKVMGITPQHVYLLIHHTVSPDIKTIYKACDILGLDPEKACSEIAWEVTNHEYGQSQV